jgi:hypothetical protein
MNTTALPIPFRIRCHFESLDSFVFSNPSHLPTGWGGYLAKRLSATDFWHSRKRDPFRVQAHKKMSTFSRVDIQANLPP